MYQEFFDVYISIKCKQVINYARKYKKENDFYFVE